MKLLSDMIDSLLCPGGRSSDLDGMLALGCRMVGVDHGMLPPEDFADIERQAVVLIGSPGLLKPKEPSSPNPKVVNDLYNPGAELDHDGYLQIHFPVPYQTPLSSSFLGNDWRFIGLAWAIWKNFKHEKPKKVVFSAFDSSGRRVIAEAEDSAISMFPQIVEASGKVKKFRSPGALCRRCSRAGLCEALKSFLFVTDPPGTEFREQREARTARLFYERMDLQTRIEALEARKSQLDKEIGRLSSDGILKLGGDLSVMIPRHRRTSYDFAKVRTALEAEGLWNDSFASILSTKIQSAMDGFPQEVQERIRSAKSEFLGEPSISEAVAHARQSPKPTIFGGVSFKS